MPRVRKQVRPAPTTDFIGPLIDKHLLEEPPRESDGFWHPSEMYSCDRMAVYTRAGVAQTDPPNINQLRIFELGKAVHERVQAIIEQERGQRVKLVRTEISIVDKEYGIKGTLDQYLEFDDESFEVEEYKSIKERGFDYLKEAKREHVLQAATYALMLRHIGQRVDRFRVTYFSKEKMQIKEFVYEWDEKWETEILTKVAELNDWMKWRILPPRLPTNAKGERHWLCGYCPYRTRCWDIDTEGDIPRAR